jgi:hypothetical protein
MENLAKAINGVVEAVQEKVISEVEGNAIIGLMVRSFTERRVASTLQHVTTQTGHASIGSIQQTRST